MSHAFRTAADWPEADYRKVVSSTLDRVARAFDEVDPDQVECELRLGVLTLTLPGRVKIILSAQPAVRQLWLALASQGTAHHFGWEASQGLWLDDKGQGLEVLSLLQEVLANTARVQVRF
jgi:iron donor protein CyaY